MKSVLMITFALVVNHYAQAQTQSAHWIDLSNKSDAEITRILEREIAMLAESPAAKAGERVQKLQMQEKSARQSFDKKAVRLEDELTKAAAAKEAVEKAVGDLQADSTTLATQIELYERSRQRLRERLDKFPFKAVMVAKAAYSNNLELVKEKMLFEAGRLAIERVNGTQIISETLVKNGVLVRDVIQATTTGKADCQPREWKTLENGTQRVIYLYGVYDIYPLSETVKPSMRAAQQQVSVETNFIKSENDAALARLPANLQQEIRGMLATAEQANAEARNSLSNLVQQEMRLLQSHTVTEGRAALQARFDALKRQTGAKRLDLTTRRLANQTARKKFWDHLNSEQRIEIVTQFDFERNRAPEVIKAKLMGECVTQFRSIVKTLCSQERQIVSKGMLVASASASMFKQVRMQGVKVLGIYVSSSEGDIKYAAAVAFRFGFEYTPATNAAGLNSLQHHAFRSAAVTLLEDDVKQMLVQQDFYDYHWNKSGEGQVHDFEKQRNGKVVLDRATGLMWQRAGSTDRMPHADAQQYIRQLNAQEFAGFSDWRLPTLEEAMSLMEPRWVDGLYIDPIFDKSQKWIWTADRASANAVWVVGFLIGHCYPEETADTSVRAVRAHQ
jgi:hypothetical protein